MWGLKHVLSYYVRQERGNITLEYRLPLSQGLKDCMSKYEVIIPTEAIDRTFVGCASALHRCDVLSEHYRKRLPEICEPFLPGIREIVNGDIPYAEVVAKILTPDRVQDCNPFEDVDVQLYGTWKVSVGVATKVKVKDKLRHEADVHPNHPSLRYYHF